MLARFVVLLVLAGMTLLGQAADSPSETELIARARPGEVVSLPALARQRVDIPQIPVRITPAPGPQFLLSDRPEYFPSNGIALEEMVQPGQVRLYVYHVPDPGAPKVITAVIENLGSNVMSLQFHRRAFSAPGTDYHLISKTVLGKFLSATTAEPGRLVPPGGRLALDPAMDAAVATRDQLVHGFYEIEIDQPARIVVLQRDPGQPTVEALDKLPRLPRRQPGKTGGGAGSGLFLTSNFEVTNSPGYALDPARGPVQLRIADGRQDPWITGRDSLDQAPARNVGNYGVLYRIRLTRVGGGGGGLALLMTKTGGSSKYCGALAAAMRVSRGERPAGTILLPETRPAFGQPGEMVLVQKFPALPAGQTEEIELAYSPPGAACIPTPLLFVPY